MIRDPPQREENMAREAKHIVKVQRAEKPLKIPKEVSEALRGIPGRKLLDKREYVECPLRGEKVPFPECFLCKSFIRRVKGYVHCSGEGYGLKI